MMPMPTCRVCNVTLAVNLTRHSAVRWDDAAVPDDFRGIEKLLHAINRQTLLDRLNVPEEFVPHFLAMSENAEEDEL